MAAAIEGGLKPGRRVTVRAVLKMPPGKTAKVSTVSSLHELTVRAPVDVTGQPLTASTCQPVSHCPYKVSQSSMQLQEIAAAASSEYQHGVNKLTDILRRMLDAAFLLFAFFGDKISSLIAKCRP